MPLLELLKKQFTGTKMLFHVLFWGFHWYAHPLALLIPDRSHRSFGRAHL